MCKINVRRLGLLFIAMFSAAIISGCACMNTPYRVYYQDKTNCQFYYEDATGQRVYDGVYHKRDFNADYATTNANGDYVDLMGNQVYRSRMCD